MTNRFNDHHPTQHSPRWLGVLSFVVLLIVSGAGLTLWRLQSVQVLSVQTNSMAPLIRPGDAVIVHKTTTVKPGEVISYHSPLNPAVIVTHRVLSIDKAKGVVITKGDNAPREDMPFSPSLVVGTVNYHILKLGYALNFLRSPAGLIVGVYLPAIIIVGQELRRLSGFYARPTYRLMGYGIARIMHS